MDPIRMQPKLLCFVFLKFCHMKWKAEKMNIFNYETHSGANGMPNRKTFVRKIKIDSISPLWVSFSFGGCDRKMCSIVVRIDIGKHKIRPLANDTCSQERLILSNRYRCLVDMFPLHHIVNGVLFETLNLFFIKYTTWTWTASPRRRLRK